MIVRNKRPWAVEIATNDFYATVEADGTAEVPEAVGKSLIEQYDAWEEVSNKATTATDKKGK